MNFWIIDVMLSQNKYMHPVYRFILHLRRSHDCSTSGTKFSQSKKKTIFSKIYLENNFVPDVLQSCERLKCNIKRQLGVVYIVFHAYEDLRTFQSIVIFFWKWSIFQNFHKKNAFFLSKFQVIRLLKNKFPIRTRNYIFQCSTSTHSL